MLKAEIEEKEEMKKASKYINKISKQTGVSYQNIIAIISTEYAEQYYNKLIEKGIITNE